MADGKAQEALRNARHAIGMVDNPRLESVREQLSQILFGDEDHSVAQSLGELRRREEIQQTITHRIEAAAASRQRFVIQFSALSTADFWSALEACLMAPPERAALNPASQDAEPKVCLCDSCKEAKECSFVESTGRPSGWLCGECDARILLDQALEAESDRRNAWRLP